MKCNVSFLYIVTEEEYLVGLKPVKRSLRWNNVGEKNPLIPPFLAHSNFPKSLFVDSAKKVHYRNFKF